MAMHFEDRRGDCSRGVPGSPIAQSGLVERRAHRRHRVAANQAIIMWSDGTSFRSESATFRDVSREGAMIVTDVVPPHDRLLVALVEPTATRFSGARVAWVSEERSGVVEVGLHFGVEEVLDHFKALIGRGDAA